MAKVVFVSGQMLEVAAEPSELLELVAVAQRGGATDLPAGWVELVTTQDTPVFVQVSLIAYIASG